MRQTLSALMLAVALCCVPSYGADLSPTDVAAVRRVLGSYVSEWLAGNAAGVMRQLTSDSVMVPGEKPPIVGATAIEHYWWPPDAPPFKLDRYTTTIDQISGGGASATVRGTQVIEWTSGRERWRARGNYVTLLRKTTTGWRIAMQMAANAPNEKLP